jgi:DNA repair ATPase RecN
MRLRTILILSLALLLMFAAVVAAQESGNAAEQLEKLRMQLSDVHDREAELKIRLEQLEYDLKPENIERYFNAVGSTRPEELREARRRQLQTEKDRVLAQLDQLSASKARLETAITNAQARAYQESALGAVALQPESNRGSHFLTLARTLVAVGILLMAVAILVLRLMIRRNRHI